MTDVRIDSPKGGQAPGLAAQALAAPAVNAPAPAAVVPFGPSTLLSTVNASLETVAEALRPRASYERYRYKSPHNGPSTPPRIETPVATADPALRGMAYRANVDIHYDGDFVVPQSTDVAVHLQDVLAKPNWQQFVRDHLSYGNAAPGDPLRIYISGLNASIKDNDRRGGIVARETGYQFAEIDNAISAPLTIKYPGGTYELPVRGREWAMAILQRLGVSVPAKQTAEHKPGIRTSLADLSDPNTRIIDNTQRLAMAYIDSDDQTPLELWAYSEGTLVAALAITSLEDRYLSEHMKGVPANERAAKVAELEKHFKERCDKITVIFVGSAASRWKAPIRRIDFYASADMVVKAAGPIRKFAWYRKVNDTLTPWRAHDAEINYPQPFKGLDAHNLFASGAPALSLYMEMNGIRTMRELYDLWQAGKLKEPTLEQVKARIREQHGTDELWSYDSNHQLADPAPAAK